MAFLKVGHTPKKVRRLYLFDITLKSGLKVVKIGVASGASSVERMFQVNRDYFMKHRVSFACGIKRDREVDADVVFKYETRLHNFFSDYQYKAPTKFDGCTELFCIPLEDATQAYEAVLEGLEPPCKYKLPEAEVDIDNEVAF